VPSQTGRRATAAAAAGKTTLFCEKRAATMGVFSGSGGGSSNSGGGGGVGQHRNAHAQDLLSRTEHLLKKYQNHLPENADERVKREIGIEQRGRQQYNSRAKNGNGQAMTSGGGGAMGKFSNNSNVVEDDESGSTRNNSFEQFLYALEAKLDDISDVSERAKTETNRAAIAAMHAEVRRGKNSLRGEIPKLRKLATSDAKMKKKKKSNMDDDDEDASTMYERDERETLIDRLEQRIEDVPDGVSRMIPRTPSKKVPHQHKRSLSRDIELGSMGFPNTNPFEQPETLREQHLYNNNKKKDNNRFEGMEHTEESRQFRQEFEDRKKKQDVDLDEISRGLQTLKRLGADMDEEMARQRPAIENIDFKMDGAQAEMKTANMRLKETVEKARSSRHFCIDATLICVLLGIGMYLYRTLK
jgi:SYP7 family syntaxin